MVISSTWIVLIVIFLLAAFIINIIYSIRFSTYLSNSNAIGSSRTKLVNDLQITSWLFNSVPVLNVILSGFFGYYCSKLNIS